MNELFIENLKERPLFIPCKLLKYYKELDISEEELIVLIAIINIGNRVVYNPLVLEEMVPYDKYSIMMILSSLSDKNIISINVETNDNNMKEEYIYLDLLYNKLFNLIANNIIESTDNNDTVNNLYTTFEKELGRTISPIEVEIIDEWIKDGASEELILEALKEAIYNNVRNFKYIDRIIFNWKNNGIKSKKDIKNKKEKEKVSEKVSVPLYDYNWLDEE